MRRHQIQCRRFVHAGKAGRTSPSRDPDRLLAANSLSHVINQLTKIIGPALGRILTVFLDLQQIFLVNAGLSLIAVEPQRENLARNLPTD